MSLERNDESDAGVLSAPFELPCGLVLKNRLVKAAVSDSLGDGAGNPTEEQIELCRRWPVGGAALSLDQRIVKARNYDDLAFQELGEQSDGQYLLWARIPDVITGMDATTLAVLGDFLPSGVGQALGVRGGGNSLDNTLQVCRMVPAEWVLMDVRVHAVERGFGHGLVHMFAEDGTLLATASQSVIVRLSKT